MVDTLGMVDNKLADMSMDVDLSTHLLKTPPIIHLQMEPQRGFVGLDENIYFCTIGLPPFYPVYYFICKQERFGVGKRLINRIRRLFSLDYIT
jgi:hypothetical protein